VKINLGRFFMVTGALLVFVAAGILAYGVHDLQEAGILPGLNTLAFDVSAAIPPDSWYGVLLKGVFNFSPQTTVLQAVVWVIYVGVVLTLFLRPQRSTSTAPAPPPPLPNRSSCRVPGPPRLPAGSSCAHLSSTGDCAPTTQPAPSATTAPPDTLQAEHELTGCGAS
jgi:hypothetical protein